MHMICTVFPDEFGNDKPAYFSSPDGITWNGSPAPYSAQLTDMVSVSEWVPCTQGMTTTVATYFLRDNGGWTLYLTAMGFTGGQSARSTGPRHTGSPPYSKAPDRRSRRSITRTM